MSVKRHPQPEILHPQARAREKQASREADAHVLASGRRSPRQLRSENEAFAPLAARGAVRLYASRSLG
jgi:hypothetical protein